MVAFITHKEGLITPSRKLLSVQTNDVAYQFNMPSGIPGSVSRAEHATIEAQLLSSTNQPIAYGVPVKIVSGKVQGFQSTDTTAFGITVATGIEVGTKPHGILIRPYPTNSGQDPLGISGTTSTQTMPTSGIVDVMVRGYVMVFVGSTKRSSAAKDSQVFYSVVSTGSYLVGEIEGGADGSNTVPLYGAYFTGAADAQGNCEIAFNI